LSEEERRVAIGERDPKGKWQRERGEVLAVVVVLLLHKWKEGEVEGPNQQSAIFPRLSFPTLPSKILWAKLPP